MVGAWQRVAAHGTVVVTILATLACASGPVSTARPSPFPRAPIHAWPASAEPNPLLPVEALIHTATGLKGAPYRLGGTTPQSGFDCSGFVRYVFQQHQLDLPRTAAEQFGIGVEVHGTEASAGDLIFFSTVGPGATHVGIIVDPVERTFVHAPGTGSVVRVERFDTPYWRTRMLGVRRLVADARFASR
jgi:cell wall-associated NlpC family hydrolase